MCLFIWTGPLPSKIPSCAPAELLFQFGNDKDGDVRGLGDFGNFVSLSGNFKDFVVPLHFSFGGAVPELMPPVQRSFF